MTTFPIHIQYLTLHRDHILEQGFLISVVHMYWVCIFSRYETILCSLFDGNWLPTRHCHFFHKRFETRNRNGCCIYWYSTGTISLFWACIIHIICTHLQYHEQIPGYNQCMSSTCMETRPTLVPIFKHKLLNGSQCYAS